MSDIEQIGIIGGHKIYADTGQDQIKILQAEVMKRVAQKQLQAGQKFIMRVDFGKDLIIEVQVKESPNPTRSVE